MNIKYATEFAREFIKNHPEHKGEVLDYYSLMKDEISEGGSTDHEIELFIGSCNDLLTKDNLAKDGVEINNEKDKEDEKGTLTEDGKKLLIAEFQDVKDDTKRRFKFIKDHPEVLKYLLKDGGGVYKGGGGVGNMQVLEISIEQGKNRSIPKVKRIGSSYPYKNYLGVYAVNTLDEANELVKDISDFIIYKIKYFDGEGVGLPKYAIYIAEKKSNEYWERRENLEMFLNLNDEDIYWKWVNGELTDAMAVELIEETQGVKFDTTKKYYNGGFVGKGELVWRKLTDSKKAQFLYENFTPQITPRTQEILTGKTFQFLPKIVKMKIESKYANVEQFAKGNTVKSGQFDRDKNGSLYDRGSSDSWYGRGKNPHWYPEGTYHGYPITKDFLTKEEIEEYNKGYDFNESEGGRKEYAKGNTIKEDYSHKVGDRITDGTGRSGDIVEVKNNGTRVVKINYANGPIKPELINVDEDDIEYWTVLYAKGGGLGDENREMVLNNNKQIRHHTEELHQILKKDKAEVPAWVVSKVGRATTDLSDATHYLEGSIEKAANGMKIGTGRAGKSLMVMDYKIWDKLNIESGSQLYNDKELQKRYAKEIKMGIEKLGYDQLNEKAFDYLENWNYHALNSALTYMGYYGLERLNRTLDFNKEMMEIDRTPYGLDPNIFIGELKNKDPKYFIGVEDMKSMMVSLYTYNYGEVDKNDKYLLDYQEKLGKSLFDKTYNEELERLKEYEIESNVFTDSEGLTYNSLKKKMAEKGTNIDGNEVSENDEYELRLKPIEEEDDRGSIWTYWVIDYRKKGYKKPLFSNPFKTDWTRLVPIEMKFGISISIGEYQEYVEGVSIYDDKEKITEKLNEKYGILDGDSTLWDISLLNSQQVEYQLRIFNKYSRKDVAESIAKLLSANNDKFLKLTIKTKQEMLEKQKEKIILQKNYMKPSYFVDGGGVEQFEKAKEKALSILFRRGLSIDLFDWEHQHALDVIKKILKEEKFKEHKLDDDFLEELKNFYPAWVKYPHFSKMAGGGGGDVKYKKGGPVKDYTGTDFSKLIDDLKVFLIKYPYIWKKDGKSYVPIEGWQFAAALMGYTTRVVSVNEIENGYMSMAEVIDQDGKVVGSGFGLVTKDEAKWANSQKYELASFSQTRAVSRALRNCISWVIKAAGYKTTPAEEMYGVGSSKMQNMPKYNAPATPKTIVQYPSMTPATPPMTTEAPMPDAFEEIADMLRPQKSPMAKNPDFKYKDILRDLYSQAVAYSIVLISPKFMSDVEESLLVDDNDLHYTMLERAYLYLLDNNIVLKTTRYMTKLRKIVNGENFAYGGLLKELPIEIYNAIVESGHQNDIISFDIEPFNSNGDRDKTINVEGVDYYISTKINSEEIANDLNNNTSLNHNYYIADIGGNELLISNN